MKINSVYDISVDGTIRNLKTNRTLNPSRVGAGYRAVNICGNSFYVHRLVARCFLPAPTCPLCEIDHIDRNKDNNHASNLRWVSKQENLRNRNIERRPRKGNTLGHHHISEKVINDKKLYRVVFNRWDLRHYSIHDTLEEAILKRDAIIENAVCPAQETTV